MVSYVLGLIVLAISLVPQHKNVEERVIVLLSGYEFFPSKEDLTELDADVHQILLRIALDPKNSLARRHKAIDALGYFKGDQVFEALNTGILQPALENQKFDLTLHHALMAIVKGQELKGVEAAEPFLFCTDLQTRLATIAAFGQSPSQKAKELLNKALNVERSKLAQERIRMALGLKE